MVCDGWRLVGVLVVCMVGIGSCGDMLVDEKGVMGEKYMLMGDWDRRRRNLAVRAGRAAGGSGHSGEAGSISRMSRESWSCRTSQCNALTHITCISH